MTTKNLAIISPYVGVKSESFIHRHMDDLYPNTFIIAKYCKDDLVSEIDSSKKILIYGKKDQDNELWTKVAQKIKFLVGYDQMKSIKSYLRKNKIDVILSEYLDFTVSFVELARSMKIKIFAHAHGYDISLKLMDPYWKKRYLILNDADGLITMSEYSRKRLIEIGIQKQKINVIPYGVKIPKILPKKKSSSKIVFLAVGRMVSKKAPILLLEAFKRALKFNQNLVLYVIGDGPLFSAAWQFIQANKLSDKIKLCGALSNKEVLDYMVKCDVFIQHSITCPFTGDQEGLPVAILEALSFGMPVISTKHTGIPEAIEDGVNGFLVDEHDINGMANRIIDISSNLDLKNKMSNSAVEIAKSKFSWEKEKESLLNLMGLD